MQELMHDPAPERLRPALLGAWDFSLDITSEAVTDTSGNELHGCTVNMPARGVTGFNWMGEELCWRYAPEQWGAIHFHEDDLYDADWEVDFELAVTGRMKSGLYAARLRSGASEEYVPSSYYRSQAARPNCCSSFRPGLIWLTATNIWRRIPGKLN